MCMDVHESEIFSTTLALATRRLHLATLLASFLVCRAAALSCAERRAIASAVAANSG